METQIAPYEALSNQPLDEVRAAKRILIYLKQGGEKRDMEIAQSLHLALDEIRGILENLAATGEVMLCHFTRFEGATKTEGVSVRLSGTLPLLTAGRIMDQVVSRPY